MKTGKKWAYLSRAPKIMYDTLLRGQYDFEYDLMSCRTSHMPFRKRINVLKAGSNLLYRSLRTWSLPLHMHFELTNYCNLKCLVCPTGRGLLTRRPQALDPALFERLMQEVGPYLLTASLWGWGEPLLHPALSDILRIQHNRGINTFLSTNGQVLSDEKVLRSLIDYPPTYLIVCLDGITDETNSVFRTGAKLAPALYGVRELARLKRKKGSQFPVLHHRFIAMKHNQHELAELPHFSAQNQFEFLTIRTLSIIDAPDESFNRLKPSETELNAYAYQDGKRISAKDFICEKAFIFPAVFADGTVVACDQDNNAQQPYGNLADGTSFEQIWNSRQAMRIRKTIRDNPAEFSFCLNCPFKDRPGGDCSIQRYDLRKMNKTSG
jgi:radical SAM protein with 4Fe4S-binding SPASM domain